MSITWYCRASKLKLLAKEYQRPHTTTPPPPIMAWHQWTLLTHDTLPLMAWLQ